MASSWDIPLQNCVTTSCLFTPIRKIWNATTTVVKHKDTRQLRKVWPISQRRAPANTAISLRVPSRPGSFLIIWASIRISRRTLSDKVSHTHNRHKNFRRIWKGKTLLVSQTTLTWTGPEVYVQATQGILSPCGFKVHENKIQYFYSTSKVQQNLAF